MLVLSGFIVVGFWINRYLNVMPILEPAHVPFADVREWFIAISALASWFFLVLVMFRSMPMISAWQISHYATEEQLEAAS